MAEYDAEFEMRYEVKVAFPITPHQLNLFSHWDRLTDDSDLYLLVAESVKASHMGYFVRGRREAEQGSKARGSLGCAVGWCERGGSFGLRFLREASDEDAGDRAVGV